MTNPEPYADIVSGYVNDHGLESIFTPGFSDMTGLHNLAIAISEDPEEAYRRAREFDLKVLDRQLLTAIGETLLRVSGQVYVHNFYNSHGWGPSSADHTSPVLIDLPATFTDVGIRRFCYRTPTERLRRFTHPYLAFSFSDATKNSKMPGFGIPILDSILNEKAEISIA